jgi:hypothetical protein
LTLKSGAHWDLSCHLPHAQMWNWSSGIRGAPDSTSITKPLTGFKIGNPNQSLPHAKSL